MFNQLFTPKNIGNLTIKNRFVVPAMHSGSATLEHLFSEHSYSYFEARAKGGFGLIFTEFMCISEEGLASDTEVGIYNDSFIPNLKGLTDRIHKYDTLIFAQLHHAGNQANTKVTKSTPVGASSIPAKNKLENVHELTTQEVWDLIGKFSDAAVRAKEAGFDGVEVHGAHGYLIAQFLSKYFNKRTDDFGGNVSARAKFATEVIKSIKEKCGNDYPVVIRVSGVEESPYGNSIIDTIAQSILYEKAGADAIHVSYGAPIQSYYAQPGYNTKNAKQVKQAVSIPVISVGRINDPAIAESIIASGDADFVALGRQSICDSNFPNKVKENKIDEIFHCMACLQRCIYGQKSEDSEIGVSCMINPFSGKEDEWLIEEAKTKKSVTIVGAGPAGLQAAWILGKKGHKVTVLEKDDKLGGQLRLASVPPMKHDLSRAIHTYEVLAKKHNVEILRGVEVNPEVLEKYKSDICILATGSAPVIPPIKGIDNENVYKANDILDGKFVVGNKKVLVVGAGLVGCETAEFLSEFNNDVSIVDMIKEMAPLLAKPARKILLNTLAEHDVNFYPETKVLEFVEDGIKYENPNGIGELSGFDLIALAIGSRSYNPLLETANTLFNETYSIGDAKKASDAKIAIYEASKLALSI